VVNASQLVLRGANHFGCTSMRLAGFEGGRLMDGVIIPAGEARKIINEGNDVETMMVVMPFPEKH